MAVTKFMEAGTAATQGFEFWDAATASGTAAAITSNSQAVSNSVRSIKCDPGSGAAGSAYVQKNATIADSGSRLCWNIRLVGGSLGSVADIVEVQNSAGTTNYYGRLNASNKFEFVAPSTTILATGTTVFALNTDYHLCLVHNVTSSTVFTLSLYVSGVLDAQIVNGAGLGTTADRFRIGWPAPHASPNANTIMYIAHVFVDDGASGDAGDIHVTAKRPFANGSANDFATRIGAGGSGYGSGHAPQVNERPLSTTNGWSDVGTGLPAFEAYSIESISAGDVDLTGATLKSLNAWLYLKSLAAESPTIGNYINSYTVTLTTSYALYRTGYEDSPAAYTDGLGADVFVITDGTVTTVSLVECGVLFAYIPAGGAAASPFGFEDYSPIRSPLRKVRDWIVGNAMLLTAPAILPAGLDVYGRNAFSAQQRRDTALAFGPPLFVVSAPNPVQVFDRPAKPLVAKGADSLATPPNLLTAPAILPAGVQTYDRNAMSPQQRRDTALAYGPPVYVTPAVVPAGLQVFDRNAQPIGQRRGTTISEGPPLFGDVAGIPVLVYDRNAKAFVPRGADVLGTPENLLTAPSVVPAGAQVVESLSRFLLARKSDLAWGMSPAAMMTDPPPPAFAPALEVLARAMHARPSNGHLGMPPNLLTAPAVLPAGKQTLSVPAPRPMPQAYSWINADSFLIFIVIPDAASHPRIELLARGGGEKLMRVMEQLGRTRIERF